MVSARAKAVINSTKTKVIKVPKGATKLGSAGYDNPRDDIERVKKIREGSIEKVPAFENDIVNKAINDKELLSNRQRKKEENFKPKPIVIEYKIDIFRDKNQNRRLIEVLQGIPYSSLSVAHANPYLNCSFVDFKDGSSYDIWILSNNEITIIPQMRSTYASIERLSHHIFIGLREGLIKDYSI